MGRKKRATPQTLACQKLFLFKKFFVNKIQSEIQNLSLKVLHLKKRKIRKVKKDRKKTEKKNKNFLGNLQLSVSNFL